MRFGGQTEGSLDCWGERGKKRSGPSLLQPAKGKRTDVNKVKNSEIPAVAQMLESICLVCLYFVQPATALALLTDLNCFRI